jgi:hypothetical protein
MDLEAEVLAADAIATAAPVVAATACITPTNVAEKPIHAVLRTCWVALCIVFVDLYSMVRLTI